MNRVTVRVGLERVKGPNGTGEEREREGERKRHENFFLAPACDASWYQIAAAAGAAAAAAAAVIAAAAAGSASSLLPSRYDNDITTSLLAPSPLTGQRPPRCSHQHQHYYHYHHD